MARKNITTTWVIVFLMGIIFFLGYRLSNVGIKQSDKNTKKETPTILIQKQNDIRNDLSRCGGNGGDPMSNAYVPPIKCDAGGLMHNPVTMNIPINSIAINVPTQQYNVQYTQVGILTKRYGDHNHEILPLMGRRTITSRNKWQYYTVSGGGGMNLQAKLPVKVKGKTCSSEYGCEEVNSGDDVYVEGFRDTFQATIYESGMFSYIPY